MRSARWLFVLAALVLCAGVAHADGINPPDGNIGIQNGSQSVSITTLVNFPFTFVTCAGATGANATECAALGVLDGGVEPQAFFDGKNDTGLPWTTLQIDLTFSQDPSAAPFSVGCDGGTFFTINNCSTYSSVNISSGPQTVDLLFSKGTGTGVGCYDSTDSGADFACGVNSALNFLSGNGPYDNPFMTSCPSDPNEVCGNYDFVIQIGFNDPSQNPTQNYFPVLPTGGLSADVTPEPSSLILFGGGLLGLAGLIRKKLRS